MNPNALIQQTSQLLNSLLESSTNKLSPAPVKSGDSFSRHMEESQQRASVDRERLSRDSQLEAARNDQRNQVRDEKAEAARNTAAQQQAAAREAKDAAREAKESKGAKEANEANDAECIGAKTESSAESDLADDDMTARAQTESADQEPAAVKGGQADIPAEQAVADSAVVVESTGDSEPSESLAAEALQENISELDADSVDASASGKVLPQVEAEKNTQLSLQKARLASAQAFKTQSAGDNQSIDPELSGSQNPAVKTSASGQAGQATAQLSSSLSLDNGLRQGMNLGAVEKALAGAVAEQVSTQKVQTAQLPSTNNFSNVLNSLQSRLAVDNRATTAQTSVQVPVGQPQWPTAVAEKVMWMSSQKLSSAEIHLDPPELGPMQVKVVISHDQASVTFSSPHAAVREALDQGAYRLREMFTQEGINLVDVDVQDQSMAQQFGQGRQEGGQQHKDSSEEAEQVVTQTTVIRHQGLVSYYV